MDGTDEILHGGLPGQADQVLDVIHDEPCQVLGVVQILTLSQGEKQAKPHSQAERERTDARAAERREGAGRENTAPGVILTEQSWCLSTDHRRAETLSTEPVTSNHALWPRLLQMRYHRGHGSQQSSCKGHQLMAWLGRGPGPWWGHQVPATGGRDGPDK